MKLNHSLKHIVIIIISVCWLILVSILRMLFNPRKKRVYILYYHSVHFDQRDNFIKQLDILNNYGEIVNIGTCENLNGYQRKYVITFDDGFKSVMSNALPLLKERKIPCTIFVPSDYLGQKPDWGKFATVYHEDDSVLSSEELKKLDSNLVSIGSHGLSHIRLSEIDHEKLLHELKDSKDNLENLLDREVKYFSVPFGDYNGAVIDTSKKVGYYYLFTSEPGCNSFGEKEYVKKRMDVDPTDSKLEFLLKITGGYNWMHLTSKIKKKLSTKK